ncbi:protein of unknown function (plasmid) [Cupriavidus taiwanensis]|uniref:Uncharacterized protein n=1 Tax=Cupriavidus taiwanensis TaxID=164546 RepID=A0A7Z7JDK8_9BURK|nr:protein of unknown function [Cupriavidus taiwanensis]SOZ42566.1 protein of unknown function [Cupriavidus taiwanensis]SPC21579.1 protein of unknown function [Cupriavidus taiwanensis]SPD55717.1 protein of unknown function [Cupriavidus taiwanensis]
MWRWPSCWRGSTSWNPAWIPAHRARPEPARRQKPPAAYARRGLSVPGEAKPHTGIFIIS